MFVQRGVVACEHDEQFKFLESFAFHGDFLLCADGGTLVDEGGVCSEIPELRSNVVGFASEPP